MTDESRAPLAADAMPMLGLGTYKLRDAAGADAVTTALEMGYRHLDTAVMYDNEETVGDGIEAADVDDSAVFVASKLWEDTLSYADAIRAGNNSRARLGVDRLDLLYVHWPRGDYDPEETMRAMDQLVEDGVTWRIGVSNFTVPLLREAREHTTHGVFANQVELHPLLPQPDLREYCEEADVELVAYAPLARGEVFEVPEIQAVAEKHGVSEAQVSLAWLREKGVTAIPKASSEAHLADNWTSLALDLDAEDVERIDGIDRRYRCVDPDDGPWNRER
jgi:2,5-diketo-D-gluconate reductase B